MRSRSLILSLFVLFAGANLFGQSTGSRNIVSNDLSQAEIDSIVARFTRNELDFREALTNYVFNRSATIQTIGMGGQITGVYRRDSFMTFTGDGRRFERITYAPVSTLTEINVTPSDLEDLGGVNPFALEPSMISQYNFTYLGKEKIDELNLHVFEVQPKVLPDPKKSKQRVFSGRVWVDDRDLMIVKSKGKALPETKNDKYPIVETWRENVDGKYWFPAFSSSDDELVFDNGLAVKLRMRVKYEDYKLGRTDVRIVEDEPFDDNQPQPSPSPTPEN
ncbi:MAG TPA: hypothetical protein VK918_04445 [Pyrinomonadaceae bacterium]|nr:hypothetical protein [Pyrinomonadaceae bacterium]